MTQTIGKEIITQTVELITREEVARNLSISLSSVERLRRAGKLPCVKLTPRCVRYKKSDVEKLIRDFTLN